MNSKIKELSLEEVKREAQKASVSVSDEEMVQLIVFKLDTENYALPIELVKEVVITPGIASVPQTPDFIKGVANIRGDIIAMVDLMTKFGLNHSNNQQIGNYTLIIDSSELKMGILVPEVPNTMTVKMTDIDKTSEIIMSTAVKDNSIIGIVKSENKLTILIDLQEVMRTEGIDKLNHI